MITLNLTVTAWLAFTGATVWDTQTTITNLRAGCSESNSFVYGAHPSDTRLWMSTAVESAVFGLAMKWMAKPDHGRFGRVMARTVGLWSAGSHSVAAVHNINERFR